MKINYISDYRLSLKIKMIYIKLFVFGYQKSR